MSAAPHTDLTPEGGYATDVAVAALATDVGTAPAPNTLAASTCPNCGDRSVASYCPACGQKAAPLAPTLGYFVHELTHEILHVDGKIFRSLRLLLTRPGFLTREIFAGRRASYLSPIRLYLIASILAFTIGAFGSLEAVGVQYTPEPDDTPAEIQRGQSLGSAVNAAMNVWLPRAMFVLVPLFAALVMLFRRGSGHTYPQHVYFGLHVHAAWFFASALDSLFEALAPLQFAQPVVDFLTEIYIVGYFFVAFGRTYETPLWDTLWRGASIGLLYGLALIVAVTSIMLPVLWPLMFGQSS
jgi:hypothetical protein